MSKSKRSKVNKYFIHLTVTYFQYYTTKHCLYFQIILYKNTSCILILFSTYHLLPQKARNSDFSTPELPPCISERLDVCYYNTGCQSYWEIWWYEDRRRLIGMERERLCHSSGITFQQKQHICFDVTSARCNERLCLCKALYTSKSLFYFLGHKNSTASGQQTQKITIKNINGWWRPTRETRKAECFFFLF